jgi:hypothetical protein
MCILVSGCVSLRNQNPGSLDGKWMGSYEKGGESVEATLIFKGTSFTLKTIVPEGNTVLKRKYQGEVSYDDEIVEFSPKSFTENGNKLDVNSILAAGAYSFFPFDNDNVGTNFYSLTDNVLELNYVLDEGVASYYYPGSYTFRK